MNNRREKKKEKKNEAEADTKKIEFESVYLLTLRVDEWDELIKRSQWVDRTLFIVT